MFKTATERGLNEVGIPEIIFSLKMTHMFLKGVRIGNIVIKMIIKMTKYTGMIHILKSKIKATLKIYASTKLVITQNDRNHSAAGMAVLGRELSLPCFTTDVSFRGFRRSGNRKKQDQDCAVDGGITPHSRFVIASCVFKAFGVYLSNMSVGSKSHERLQQGFNSVTVKSWVSVFNVV